MFEEEVLVGEGLQKSARNEIQSQVRSREFIVQRVRLSYTHFTPIGRI